MTRNSCKTTSTAFWRSGVIERQRSVHPETRQIRIAMAAGLPEENVLSALGISRRRCAPPLRRAPPSRDELTAKRRLRFRASLRSRTSQQNPVGTGHAGSPTDIPTSCSQPGESHTPCVTPAAANTQPDQWPSPKPLIPARFASQTCPVTHRHPFAPSGIRPSPAGDAPGRRCAARTRADPSPPFCSPGETRGSGRPPFPRAVSPPT